MKNFGQPSDEAIKLLLIHMKNTSLPRILEQMRKEATEQSDKGDSKEWKE